MGQNSTGVGTNSLPFGGVSVVFVGDLFQLPPVIMSDVRELFDLNYQTSKFFGARSLASAPFYGVELKKAFRQVDQGFVELLAKIREGIELESTIELFNSKCTVTSTPPNGAVWLSPRNREVDLRNAKMLAAIEGNVTAYKGVVEGKFNRAAVPAPLSLHLKTGAQVMFTKNGSSWVNGSIGHIESMWEDKVHVRLQDTTEVVEVTREVWEQYDYKLNPTNGLIERVVIGSYRQIPLILAWSVTIHKSQGRTISRVHVDLGAGAFETGQTYVALSRCRSLDRLTLSRPLIPADIRVDPETQDFYQHLRHLIEQLPADKMMEQARQGQGSIGHGSIGHGVNLQ